MAMADKEKNMLSRRLANAYLSSVTSIALVLLLVGAASLLLVNARNISNCFKENMTVSVMMKQQVGDEEAAACMAEMEKESFVRRAQLVPRSQGEAEMKALLGDDFLDVFESSPIPVSVELSLKADYVCADSLKTVCSRLEAMPQVEELVYKRSLVDKLNSNLSKVSMVMAVFIALLLFISYVLINNTVRLSIYARRFTIHTMSMVGATRAFIRRPFLVQALFQGICAALLATLMLVALLFVVRGEFPQLFAIFDLNMLLLTFGIVLAAGALICVSSTFLVVNRLVSLRKAELYY
ncbi:MAG: permease-like cell division protein FtsX [Candidatus Cryptobacteroides sp.]|nr:permease-like cell division protein FtsX [Candidatus Cryptobacteroides sp.]